MKNQLGLKSLISFILGFPLAVTLSGLYGWLGPGTMVDRYMVVLWLLVPVWTLVFCLCVRIRSWKHTLMFLLAANLLSYLLLYLIRTASA